MPKRIFLPWNTYTKKIQSHGLQEAQIYYISTKVKEIQTQLQERMVRDYALHWLVCLHLKLTPIDWDQYCGRCDHHIRRGCMQNLIF